MIEEYVIGLIIGVWVGMAVLFIRAHFSKSDDEKDSVGCDEFLLDSDGLSHAKAPKYDVKFVPSGECIFGGYYVVDGREYVVCDSISNAIAEHEEFLQRQKEADDYRSVFEEAAKSPFFQDDCLQYNKGETLNVKFYKVGDEEISEDQVVAKIESLNATINDLQKYKENAEEEKRKQEKEKRLSIEAEQIEALKEKIADVCKEGDFVYYLDEKYLVHSIDVFPEECEIILTQTVHPHDPFMVVLEDLEHIKQCRSGQAIKSQVRDEIDAEISKIEKAETTAPNVPAPVKIGGHFRLLDGHHKDIVFQCTQASAKNVAGVSACGKDALIPWQAFELVEAVDV